MFLNFSLKEKEGWSKGYSANVSIKINKKTSRSRFILNYYCLLLIDSIFRIFQFSWINFVHIFFVSFVKYEFCASLVCIYFRECCLKKIFLRVFNFVKSIKICEKHIHPKISTLEVDIIRIPMRWRHQKLRIIILKQF